MMREAARANRNVPRRFVSITSSHSASAHAWQQCVTRDAGVVDEDVEPFPFRDDRFHQLIDFRSVLDVAADGFGFAAGRRDGLHGLRQLLSIPRDADHRRAVGGQFDGHGLAQALRSAGDHRHLPRSDPLSRRCVVASLIVLITCCWHHLQLVLVRAPACSASGRLAG